MGAPLPLSDMAVKMEETWLAVGGRVTIKIREPIIEDEDP